MKVLLFQIDIAFMRIKQDFKRLSQQADKTISRIGQSYSVANKLISHISF